MKTKSNPVSIQETLLGIGILLTLVGVAVGVYIRQFQFHPAVISRHDLLVAEGKIKVTADGEENIIPVPAGMTAMTPPEIFTPDNLYQKINGKAELYLSAGFVRLTCGRIMTEKNPDRWMEVFFYVMKSPADAFSVYSMQRRDKGTPTGVSRFSYQTGNAVFLTHGSYYLEIIASQAAPELQRFMLDFLRNFISKMPSDNATITELSLFPSRCVNLENINVIPANAFGFDKFDQVFSTACRLEGKEATVFLSDRGTPENAQTLASEYETFLKAFGGKVMPDTEGIGNARLIQIFDSYELFFTSGKYLCGVHEAENPEIAESMAAVFYDAIHGATK